MAAAMNATPAPLYVPTSRTLTAAERNRRQEGRLRLALRRKEKQEYEAMHGPQRRFVPCCPRPRPKNKGKVLSETQWLQVKPFMAHHYLYLDWPIERIRTKLIEDHNVSIALPHLRFALREWEWTDKHLRRSCRMQHKP